ncbi:MAG: response regulator transcription factor [Butyrivibrio sp.]|nr:response regulator transcription factor [Butyrivibrio sp.]
MNILIVEDDEDLNEIIVKKLKAEGFMVDNCFNGIEAIERLEYADYDVVVMDIMMPQMDGIKTISKLREDGNNTPVIFLTAKDTISDKVKGLNLGANDYVVKPFSFDELVARIGAVTRTAIGSTSSVLELADLSLDVDSHIVKRGGVEINLTGKEYGLLEYMLINKNRILSREKILSHVWGYDYEGGENIVDVYMNYIRKKVDGDYSDKLIHTVRGIGYTMKVEQ